MSIAPDADVAADNDIAPDADGSELGVAADLGPVTCANCGSPRIASYCAVCGQKAVPLNPTLKYFLHELTHELLHVDGKIFRSVKLLITRPGFLTKEILAGRRASYVTPIRLYLIFSILAFALGAAQVDVNIEYTTSPGETIDPQMQLELESTRNAAVAAVNEWLPRAMFVLVPLFAALVMLVRRKSGLNYPQHLYFALHVQAFYFLLRSVDVGTRALVESPAVLAAVLLLTTLGGLAYFVAAFRAVYGTTMWGTVWRCAVVIALYFPALVLTVIAITVPFWSDLFFGGPS